MRGLGHKRRTVAKPATVDGEVALLRAALNRAERAGQIPRGSNPCHGVRLFRIPNARERSITDAELCAIIDAVPGDVKATFLLARYTGLRKSHLLALTRKQIRDGLIWPPVVQPGGLWQSSKRHGVVPIDPDMVWLIDHLCRSANRLKVELDKARRVLGIDFQFHDLRRTFATELRRAGVAAEVIDVMMGHSPPPGVRGRYQVVTVGDPE